uniref:Uncharacterized protein n=1 Tax=Anguilla anguilla TaxID=7936 RepID=A0A0E9R8L5_ANGAN
MLIISRKQVIPTAYSSCRLDEL